MAPVKGPPNPATAAFGGAAVGAPFVLADAPQVKCFINTYDSRETTLKLLVEKLLGKSEFKGVSPVDAFCGFIDTRI